MFREKYRYKELRYFGCTLSDPQKWFDHILGYIKNWGVSDSVGGEGHLGIFWVGMCRPGPQIDTPF